MAAGQHQRPHHAQYEPRRHVHLQGRTVRRLTWTVQQRRRGPESQLPGPESHGAQCRGAGDGGGAQVDRHHPLCSFGQLARRGHAGAVPVRRHVRTEHRGVEDARRRRVPALGAHLLPEPPDDATVLVRASDLPRRHRQRRQVVPVQG